MSDMESDKFELYKDACKRLDQELSGADGSRNFPIYVRRKDIEPLRKVMSWVVDMHLPEDQT